MCGSAGVQAKRNRVGELNIPVAVAVNNFWLILWLLAFFWLNLIPGVVPSCHGQAMSLHEFGENLHVAAQCIFHGNDSYGYYNAEHKRDFCEYGGLFISMLAIAATVQMLLQAMTVQQHSATFTMALITLGPIFAVFFQRSSGIMMTKYFFHEVNSQITGFTWGGLVVVVLGIIVYKVGGVHARVSYDGDGFFPACLLQYL